MISIQALNDALVAVVFMIGAAFALTGLMVALAALWQRHSYRAGIRAVERYLAAASGETTTADPR
jgi:hypothetical protein